LTHAGPVDGLGDDRVVVAGDRRELRGDHLAQRHRAALEVALGRRPLLRRVDLAHLVQRVALGDRAVEVDDDEAAHPRRTHLATVSASWPAAISWNRGFGLLSVFMVSIRPTEMPWRWQNRRSDWRSAESRRQTVSWRW